MARDAALRGLSVTLIERRTVGWGTSSRSSRLIHGGIRYLELGDFRLVRESLHERGTLLRIAPTLVQRLPFLFVSGRGEWWQWFKVGVGVLIYRILAGSRALGRHRPLTRAHLTRIEPLLGAAPLIGGALYQDAQCDDLGLVQANADSARAAGARIIENTDATVTVHADHVEAVLPDGEVITAKAMVLALGPWTDEGRALAGLPDRKLVGGTKGIHLAFSSERLPLASHAIAFRHPSDKRVMFCIPEPERGRVFVGTTDTETDEPPDALTVSEGDVAYVLEAVRHLFPDLQLGADDIIDRWAGVRPLLNQSGAESKRSREHLLLREGVVLTIAGGKLTTYRAMAEEAVDMLGGILGVKLPASRTGELGVHMLSQVRVP